MPDSLAPPRSVRKAAPGPGLTPPCAILSGPAMALGALRRRVADLPALDAFFVAQGLPPDPALLGMEQFHAAAPEETVWPLATAAARQSLDTAGLSGEEIGALILCGAGLIWCIAARPGMLVSPPPLLSPQPIWTRKGQISMIAVIFEVEPAEGRFETYLDLAAALREDLTGLDGFISIERFESLVTPGKILSLSFWRDEDAVRRWRCHAPHRSVQEKGRDGIFKDYRLRVASVIRDYGMTDRAEAPEDSRAFHET